MIDMRSSKFMNLYNKFGVFLILILEIIIFSVGTESFFSAQNLLIVGRQVSMIGISCVGVTCVMLLGGIDISIGSIMALSGVVTVKLMSEMAVPLPLSIAVVLLVGILVGTMTGIFWTKFDVPPLISTLAFQTLVKGFAYVMTGGNAIHVNNDYYKVIGQGYIFGKVPIPFVIMIFFMAVGWWVINRTYFGRYIYAVGGNKEAARLSGVKVDRVIMWVFAANGALAAIAGVINSSRMNSGNPATGIDFPMDCITAVVLGGVSVNGGKGRYVNVIAGVIIMGILSNGLVLLGVDEYYQWIIKGIVLLMAVLLSNLQNSALFKNR